MLYGLYSRQELTPILEVPTNERLGNMNMTVKIVDRGSMISVRDNDMYTSVELGLEEAESLLPTLEEFIRRRKDALVASPWTGRVYSKEGQGWTLRILAEPDTEGSVPAIHTNSQGFKEHSIRHTDELISMGKHSWEVEYAS